MDRSLGHGSDIMHGLGKRMCEVAVRNFSHFVMGGDVSHPAVADRREFASEFELRDEVERFSSSLFRMGKRKEPSSVPEVLWSMQEASAP